MLLIRKTKYTSATEDKIEVFTDALQVHGLSETSWLSLSPQKAFSNWTQEPNKCTPTESAQAT